MHCLAQAYPIFRDALSIRRMMAPVLLRRLRPKATTARQRSMPAESIQQEASSDSSWYFLDGVKFIDRVHAKKEAGLECQQDRRGWVARGRTGRCAAPPPRSVRTDAGILDHFCPFDQVSAYRGGEPLRRTANPFHRLRRLLCLYVRLLDRKSPFGDFRVDERGVFRGAVAHRLARLRQDTLLDLRTGDDARDIGVNFFDDRLRRAPRRHEAEPGGDLETGHPPPRPRPPVPTRPPPAS